MNRPQFEILIKTYNKIMDAREEVVKCVTEYIQYSDDSEYSQYSCPIRPYQMDDAIKRVQEDMILMVRDYALCLLPNITITEEEVWNIAFGSNYFSYSTGFNRIDWYDVFDRLYAKFENVNEIAHKQIYEVVNRCFIPYVPKDNKTIEEITEQKRLKILINPKTQEITFSVSYRHNYTQELLKFIAIRLKGIEPKNALGIDLNEGEVYSDTLIRSLKLFKNGNLKIRFHDPKNSDKLIDELFKPPVGV